MTRDEILRQTLVNPVTKNTITVRYALNLPIEHPAHRLAWAMVQKNTPQKSNQPAPQKKTTAGTMQVDPKRKALVQQLNKNLKEEIEAFDRAHLNGGSLVDITAEYLSSLGVDDELVKRATINIHDDSFAEISIALADGTTMIREISVSETDGQIVINHALFELGSDLQVGSGYAKRMLTSAIRIADSIKASMVKFHAGMSAGGYVWAKYGATPTPMSRIRMYSSIKDTLDNFEEVTTERYNDARDELASLTRNDPSSRAPWTINRIKKMERQLEVIEAAQKLVKEHPEYLASLRKLLELEEEKIPAQYRNAITGWTVPDEEVRSIGGGLSPELLSFIANTPLGKFLLLDTEWHGFFDMRKGSPGRSMLEQQLS
jgi:hypothetical protein